MTGASGSRFEPAGADCDLSGVVLTSVVVHGRELILRGEGGSGRWWSNDEQRMVDVDPVSEWDAWVMVPTMDSVTFDSYSAQLVRWRDESEPLRILSWPGKHTLLMARDGTVIPIPRRSHPDGPASGCLP